MKNHQQINKIRKYFLNNSNLTIQEIADYFKTTKHVISEAITNKLNLKLVPSYCEANLYFLFNDYCERKIYTDKNGIKVINTFDFNYEEKRFLQSFGLITDI